MNLFNEVFNFNNYEINIQNLQSLCQFRSPVIQMHNSDGFSVKIYKTRMPIVYMLVDLDT